MDCAVVIKHKQIAGTSVVIFVAAALLRSLWLGRQGLFLDEAWSWAVAQLPLPDILRLSLRDPHPFFYYILLKGWLTIIPASEAGLRSLSVLCSVASLALVLVFVNRRWGARAAAYAGWFTALSSFDLYYAQEARMYTLLGFLWMLAYLLLIRALRGRPRLLIGWGLVNTALAWTHFYGLLAVGVHLVFILGLWGWYRLRRRTFPLPGRWLSLGIALTTLGILPIVFLLWNFRSGEAGGAWIPNLDDLAMLFTLSSVGLAAARSHFLDGAHLVLPQFRALSLGVWVLVGFLTSGGFAIWGILQAWRSENERRWEAILAFLLMVVPVIAAFGYASVFKHRMWALKSFMGAAYLFYMWSGIGLSRISQSFLRRGVALVALGVALISWLPYHTGWRKTDANVAFRSLPAVSDERGMVLLDRVYTAPVAFYYLGPDANVWGFIPQKSESTFALVRSAPDGILPQDSRPVGCDAPLLRDVTDVYVYGSVERIRQEQKNWPSCLWDKRMWLFESNKWALFER